MEEQKTTNTYETIIFYAGVFRYLIYQDDGIDREDPFAMIGSIRNLMTEEMRTVLLNLISIRYTMKSQNILGLVPVLQPYERLHPLFYYLSETENLYYTIQDRLIPSKEKFQELSDDASDAIQRLEVEINQLKESKSKDKKVILEELRILEREKNIRETEIKRIILGETTKKKINHINLEDLNEVQRTGLINSFTRKEILKTLELFKERFPSRLNQTGLVKTSTLIVINMTPLYNFDMSMISTQQRAEKYTIDNSKKIAAIESRTGNRNRKELEELKILKIEEKKKPFFELSKALTDHTTNLRKCRNSRIAREGSRTLSEEELSEMGNPKKRSLSEEELNAMKIIESDMQIFSQMCQNMLYTTKETAKRHHKNTAIFLQS
jgi:hypothetical protein